MAPARRLAAIMFIDVAGFTSLAQHDEGNALRILREVRELVGAVVPHFGGREVKSLGDGLLEEFSSALMAVQSAIEIQERAGQLQSGAGGEGIALRIGIHVGDVVPEGTDILGDTVNVTSRLQTLADPGGICLSGSAYEQVRYKLPQPMEKLGDFDLKGLRSRLEVYRVVLAKSEDRPHAGSDPRPRVAVLPFLSIGREVADASLGDKLMEELTTALAQRPGLSVIARTSANRYRGTDKLARHIGAELGVEYLLEGSVQGSGMEIRVTTQLIEARTEAHRWSRAFDRRVGDLDPMCREIAGLVEGALLRPGAASSGPTADPPTGPDAQHAPAPARESARTALRAAESSYCSKIFPREADDEHPFPFEEAIERAHELADGAKQEFQRRIDSDPSDAAAYVGLADATLALPRYRSSFELRFRASKPDAEARREAADEAERLLEKALQLDPGRADAHASLGHLHYVRHWGGELEAEKEFRHAISIDPACEQARVWYAQTLFSLDRREDALEQIRLAEEADPSYPEERALLTLDVLGIGPNPPWPDAVLAIYYATVGLEEKSREYARAVENRPEDARGRARTLAIVHAYLHETVAYRRWLKEAIARKETELLWWEEAPRLGSLTHSQSFRDLFAGA